MAKHRKKTFWLTVGSLGMTAVAGAALVVAVVAGSDSGTAAADAPDESFFIDIEDVKPNVKEPKPGNGASTGTFTVDCGKNENKHFNPDNFIAQPGVENGAEHLHDYVGNESTDADSTNESLEKADTTCKNGDKSAYFWPVLRILDEDDDTTSTNSTNAPNNFKRALTTDTNSAPDNEKDKKRKDKDKGKNDNNPGGNEGKIQRPKSVDITFRGSPTDNVVAMPKFLRILYGDAKVGTNGKKNARNSWTCSGFEDKVLTNKYPICPENSEVVRIHDFPSCWDGENTDSDNHRDHIVYANENGECEDGFKAVPQLRITLTYDIPRDVQLDGLYAIDSFPEEEHDPFSDHDDFANVMSDDIMNRLVDCVNDGEKCVDGNGRGPANPTKTNEPTSTPTPDPTDENSSDGGPTANALLAKLGDCNQISNDQYKTDAEAEPTVPVCETGDVVWYEADLDIDCDGQESDKCNAQTDDAFQDDTAFHDSNDQPLKADELPYVVVPSASANWNFEDFDLEGGGVVAIIFEDKVEYVVIGDTGPEDIIGEASHAAAVDLGIDPDPNNGGSEGPVTYIYFKGAKAEVIEDHEATVEQGEQLAQEFVDGN